MRADWTNDRTMRLLLTALMPANRLAMRVSLETGLRIDDVLSLHTSQLKTQRITVKERKTGKTRRVYLQRRLYELLLGQAGRAYVFEGRCDWRRHRTRQAVYKDLRRAARLYRIDGKKIAEHISPHTARKIYAVHDLQQHGGDVEHVQHDLNHTKTETTMLYAFSDKIGGKNDKKNTHHKRR